MWSSICWLHVFWTTQAFAGKLRFRVKEKNGFLMRKYIHLFFCLLLLPRSSQIDGSLGVLCPPCPHDICRWMWLEYFHRCKHHSFVRPSVLCWWLFVRFHLHHLFCRLSVLCWWFFQGPSFLATGISYQQENVTVYASSVQASATQGLSASIPSPVPSMSTSSFVAASASIGIPSSGSTTTTTTRTIYTLRSYNDPSLVVATLVQPLVCETTTGVQGSCSFSSPPSPTYNFSENVCKNVLQKVRSNIASRNFFILMYCINFWIWFINQIQKLLSFDFNF